MNRIFLTGATGYIGSYVVRDLIHMDRSQKIVVLVRGKTIAEAEKKIWKAWQIHFDFETFSAILKNNIQIVLGDISLPLLGLNLEDFKSLAGGIDSIIHCAASLNRKSEKTCLNVNLKGTLHVITLAQEVLAQGRRLLKFSEVSTVAVAGQHQDDFVVENEMIDWDRSDYDPYARTKKFCEHMVHELLPNTSKVIFRPSIVLGDDQRPETTQFDMVRAFVWLSRMPVLPFSKDWRLDIVNVNYVSKAIATIHTTQKPTLESYNLSSGSESLSCDEIVSALVSESKQAKPIFIPSLEPIFRAIIHFGASLPKSWSLSRSFALMKVFWPYLTFNTVFDNTRVVGALGYKPTKFSFYAAKLRQFAEKTHFQYPYQEWPAKASQERKVA